MLAYYNDKPVNDGDGGSYEGPPNDPSKAPLPKPSNIYDQWSQWGNEEDAIAAAIAASMQEAQGGGGGGGMNGHGADLEAGMGGADRPRSDSMENQIGDTNESSNAVNHDSDLLLAMQLSQQDQREYRKLSGVDKGRGQSNNGGREVSGDNNLRSGGSNGVEKHESFSKQPELTFEECVKKFNKHKVAGFYVETERRYRPCIIEKTFPGLKKILLRFNSNNNKFHTINPEDFPITCIQFDYTKYVVDTSMISSGLGAELFKYTEGEDPLDDGCEVFMHQTSRSRTK